jgi:hypothetical protein
MCGRIADEGGYSHSIERQLIKYKGTCYRINRLHGMHGYCQCLP